MKQQLVKHPDSDNFKVTEKIYFIRSFSNNQRWYEINATKKLCSCSTFLKSKNGEMCSHLKKHFRIPQEKGFTPSLLKSNIQKCIRKGEVVKSVKSAKLLLRKNPNQLLRRLPIIIIEDVILLTTFPRLVDLASESGKKNFVLNKEDEKFVLSVVEQLARCKWRDTEFLEFQQGRKNEYLKKGKEKLTKKEEELISSINYRSRMGGLSDDILMLKIVARIWKLRFTHRKYTIKKLNDLFPKPEIDYDKISLKECKEDVLLESVDFHCSPLVKVLLRKQYIKDLFREKFGNLTTMQIENKLKDIIWRIRSGINYKLDINTSKEFNWLEANEAGVYDSRDKKKYQEIFDIIKTETDNISKWFILKNLEN